MNITLWSTVYEGLNGGSSTVANIGVCADLFAGGNNTYKAGL